MYSYPLICCGLRLCIVVRTLELLKVRFGEGNLHNCEVMMRDIADSKKLNAKISQIIASKSDEDSFDITTTIVSSHYWPTFIQLEMNHHPHIQKVLTQFSDGYKVRLLYWA